MARKNKMPTGERLAKINAVLRNLAQLNIFVGDRTNVVLAEDIEIKNVGGAVAHVAKTGEMYVAELQRYGWIVQIPTTTDLSITWNVPVEIDACAALPKTADEQEAAMISYANINATGGSRFRQYLKDNIPVWAIDVRPDVD